MTNKITKKYKIDGMHCVSCAMLIEGELEDAKLVDEASCKYGVSELIVTSEKEVDDSKIIEIVGKLGYKATPIT